MRMEGDQLEAVNKTLAWSVAAWPGGSSGEE